MGEVTPLEAARINASVAVDRSRDHHILGPYMRSWQALLDHVNAYDRDEFARLSQDLALCNGEHGKLSQQLAEIRRIVSDHEHLQLAEEIMAVLNE